MQHTHQGLRYAHARQPRLLKTANSSPSKLATAWPICCQEHSCHHPAGQAYPTRTHQRYSCCCSSARLQAVQHTATAAAHASCSQQPAQGATSPSLHRPTALLQQHQPSPGHRCGGGACGGAAHAGCCCLRCCCCGGCRPAAARQSRRCHTPPSCPCCCCRHCCCRCRRRRRYCRRCGVTGCRTAQGQVLAGCRTCCCWLQPAVAAGPAAAGWWPTLQPLAAAACCAARAARRQLQRLRCR